MVEHIFTYTHPVCEPHINKACKALQQGKVLAYPTDINWAVGCSPYDKKAIKKLQQIKRNHPQQKPFSLICSSLSMAAQFAHINASAYKTLKKILPGSYTVLLPSHKNLHRILNDKRPVVGIRIPNQQLVTSLATAFGSPILSSSLIESEQSKEPITNGWQIIESYGHIIDLVLDLKTTVDTRETTVLDMSSDHIQIIRKGYGDTNIIGS